MLRDGPRRSRPSPRSLALLLGLAALSGCSDGRSLVTVTASVEGSASVAGLDHLAVTATDEAQRQAGVQVPVAGAIPPAVVFTLRFPASTSGRVHLAVSAEGQDGVALAFGESDVTLAPPAMAAAAVVLRPVVFAPADAVLSFSVSPQAAVAGKAISPPVQVALKDKAGQLVTGANLQVRLALGKNPAMGQLMGTVQAPLSGGVAVFPDLRLDALGDGYTLTASADRLQTVESAPFTVGPPRWLPASVGLFGASVTALAVDPKHPATVYAATSDTGVWVSTDGAASWRVVSAGLPRRPVLALAVDPVTTTTLYAATDGAGLYKSETSGASWSAVNGGVAGMGTDTFYAVAVDPAHPATVYAGHNGPKVYRSSNGGGSWSEVSAGIQSYGPPARSFAINPFDGTVFVATYGSGLYRMAYGGTAWTAVGGAPLTGTGKYLNAVAYDPGNSQVLYVGGETSPDRLFRSTDGGATWSRVPSPPPLVGSLSAFNPGGGGATRWYVGQGGAGAGAGVYSAPDGMTFSNGAGINEKVTAVAADPATAGVAYAATATGVYKTTNGLSWSLRVSGLTGNPVTALAIDPKTPANLYVGLRNAGLLRSTDGAGSWSPPAAAGNVPPAQGVTGLAVDEGNPKLLWAGTRSGAWRSDSGGTTFVDGALGRAVTSLLASPVTAGTFYAGSTGNAFVITAASGWTPAGSGLPAMDVVSLAAHPRDPMTLYAGLAGGGVYRTESGGAAWTSLSAGLPTQQVAAVAADPAAPGRLLVGTDQGVFASTGGAFSPSSQGLGAAAVTALSFSRKDPRVVFAGTLAGGVFRSTDGGVTWGAYSAGLTTLAITHLALDPQDPLVAYAGTFDGGVFKTSP